MSKDWSASRRVLLCLSLVSALLAVGVVVAVPAGRPAVADISSFAGEDVGDVPELGPSAGVVSFGSGGIQPLVPGRLLDTRTGVGAPVTRLGEAATLELQVSGRGGVPRVGAGAVVLNVTATEPSQPSFVTVFPTGAPRPTASNLNFVAGETVPNLVVAKIGVGGKVSLFNRFGGTHLIADVAGWFPEASGLQPMSPVRVLDTRMGVGAPAAPVGPDGSVELSLAGRAGLPSTGVGAVVLNVTVTAPTAAGFVTVFPAGETRPTASNLNFSPGQTVPNLVIVKLGAGGKVELFNRFGSSELIADVVGWFPSASELRAINPARLLDTRVGVGAPVGAVGPGSKVAVQIAGRAGIPATGVGAVAINVTVTEPTASGFITASPTGVARPTASNLNFGAGQTVPNLVIVKVGASGAIDLFNSHGSSHLIGDVVGWFPAAGSNLTTLDLRPGTVLGGPGDVVSSTGNSDSGGTVTLAASADVAPVGGHLAISPHPVVPDGMFGKVTGSVRKPDGTRRVTLAPASLDDAFNDIDSTFKGQADMSPVQMGAPLVESESPCSPSGTVAIGGAVDLDLGADIDYDLSDRYLKVLLEGELTVTLNVSISGSVTCRIEGPPLVSVFGVMLAEVATGIDVGVAVSGPLEASISATASAAVGFVANGLDIRDLSEMGFDRAQQVGGQVTAELTFRPFLEIDLKAFGLVGVVANVGIDGTVSYTLPDCVEISAGISSALSGELGRWGMILLSIELAGRSFGPWTIYQSNGCKPQIWTGTFTIDLRHIITNLDAGGRFSSSFDYQEMGSYVLRVPPDNQTGADGSGSYPASISASGTMRQTWVECALPQLGTPVRDYVWNYSPTVRSQSMRFEYQPTTETWNWQPILLSRKPWNQGDSGQGTVTETTRCTPSGQPDVFVYNGDLEYFVLGWGVTAGLAPLNDTNPDPDRLVGTTTWSLTNPPPVVFDDTTTGYSFTATYDLTLEPRP